MSTSRSDLPPPRRNFMVRLIAGSLGVFLLAVPIATAIGFLLSPLRSRRGAVSDDKFIPLPIGPDALTVDGPPQLVSIEMDRIDSWNLYPRQPVGSVWIRRTADEIVAWNAICPHLGCAIDYRSSHRDFFCPCHESNFDIDGERQNQIPPRDMDRLATKVVDGLIWVMFENFRGGTREKIEV